MSTPRVRMAPSPTGFLHIGTARAALFNYLFAKHHGGTFILRIEDTDLERSDKKFEKNIFEGLRWLGIEPDEGVEQGGPFAPYRQTERLETYQKHLDRLFNKNLAFYCFHTKEELEKEQEELQNAKRPALHLCEYRTMDPVEAEELARINPNYVIRFKTPPARRITFHDLIRGEITFETDILGDFSIARKKNAPLYHFAVVVDDIEMQITHAIRGEDHIPNTPKHILLFEALGFAMPQFAHLPLVLGPDRSKLSKRHGATSIDEFRKEGYLSEALFNFIALLGWSPGDDQEIMPKEEIIELFSLEKMQKSGAIFDIQKLDWMNGEYIRRKSPHELVELCRPYLDDFLQMTNSKLQISKKEEEEYLKKIIVLEQPRLKKLSEIGERVDFFFRTPEYDKELLRWKGMDDGELKKSLELSLRILEYQTPEVTKEDLEKLFFEEIGKNDKGKILWPLRVALTGKKGSPGPFEIIEILGKDVSTQRITIALGKLG